MHLKPLLSFLLLPGFLLPAAAQLKKEQYRADFDFFWTTVKDHYAYWDKKKTDWNKVKEIYAPQADTITRRSSFVLLLEKLFCEIYDHHASLNTNTPESQRLVPSGADVWAEFQDDRAVVLSVHDGSAPQKAGVRAGMTVLEFNGVKVKDAIRPFLAKSLRRQDVEANNYALRVLLAGKHSEVRKILFTDGRSTLLYQDEQLDPKHDDEPLVTTRLLPNNVGYIRINNCLWNNDLIAAFDSVLASMKHTSALILDMRETPSGGNTTVARAIMGSFISHEGFYQKHELPEEERDYGIKRSWMEIVSPRKQVYAQPLVVLAGRWTGSVGEGIVIGFDALKRATIMGTEMARLNGSVETFTMPNCGINFSFPMEKLYHVNGSPREFFTPTVLIDLAGQKIGQDLILEQAQAYLRR